MSVIPYESILDTALDIIREQLDGTVREIQPEATLENLGFDSLLVSELIVELEERCGFEMTEDQLERLADATSIHDLVSVFAS